MDVHLFQPLRFIQRGMLLVVLFHLMKIHHINELRFHPYQISLVCESWYVWEVLCFLDQSISSQQDLEKTQISTLKRSTIDALSIYPQSFTAYLASFLHEIRTMMNQPVLQIFSIPAFHFLEL